MPEFPEIGQLNKFFGKNGFPPETNNCIRKCMEVSLEKLYVDI